MWLADLVTVICQNLPAVSASRNEEVNLSGRFSNCHLPEDLCNLCQSVNLLGGNLLADLVTVTKSAGGHNLSADLCNLVTVSKSPGRV